MIPLNGGSLLFRWDEVAGRGSQFELGFVMLVTYIASFKPCDPELFVGFVEEEIGKSRW